MFSETLLELEESLCAMQLSGNTLMLNNLDLKADLNRFSAKDVSEDVYDAQRLTRLFQDYDYTTDEFTECTKCRLLVSQSTALCCKSTIEQASKGFRSDIERDYWLSFMNNPYKTILMLPNYTKMTFFQTVIPVQMRNLAWQKLVLVNQKNLTQVPTESKVLFTNFQHSYNRSISSQINKDLSRTFPQIPFFQNEDTVSSLLTILNVYANYDLELGYCQGLLFLVGTLFYNFRNLELTFHALCKVMECEPQLRAIFVPSTMSSVLDKWYTEFMSVLSVIDPQLKSHMAAFCDCKVFLYQWWLSVNLIHTPDFSINNRIIDFCLMEGWKVGIFKVSIGLLLRNKPLLMSLGEGDEEVAYQHLLNDTKWGNAIRNVTNFFGELLFSFDETLFVNLDLDEPNFVAPPKTNARKVPAHKGSSVLEMFKSFSMSTGSLASSPPQAAPLSAISSLSEDSFQKENRSRCSVFSSSKDNDLIYSDSTTGSWEKHSLRVPARKESFSDCGSIRTSSDDLAAENETMRQLLKKAYGEIRNESLKKQIRDCIKV